MNPIDSIEANDLKKGLPHLSPGDTVRVHVRVKESTVKEEIKGKPKETEREREKLRRERIGSDGVSVKHGRVDFVAQAVDAANVDELKAYADRYLEKVKSGIVTLTSGDKFVIKVSKDLTSQYDANRLKAFFGGRGGGPAHLVTGTLSGVSAEDAFKRLEEELGTS